MRQKRRSYGDDEDGFGDDLAAVNERLESLTRQIERLTQAGALPRRPGGREPPQDRVADALARLDRRLDQVINEGRGGAPEFRTRPPVASSPGGSSDWTAQIMARQRALDGGGVTAPAATVAPQPASAQWDTRADFTRLEEQLRQINAQISSLQQPYEDAFATLRADLADIGLACDVLKWEPKVPLEQGLKKTIEYFDGLLRSNDQVSRVGR